MRSLPAIIALAGFLIGLVLAPEAWAQAPPPEPACAQASGGVDCPEVTRRGGWGLIVLGAIFFAVWFMPPRADSEKGRGFMDSLPIMGTLQRRIDKELSGWRRFQWPLIGLSFMSLGLAFLFGWL